jgi:hypothetical protein
LQPPDGTDAQAKLPWCAHPEGYRTDGGRPIVRVTHGPDRQHVQGKELEQYPYPQPGFSISSQRTSHGPGD